MPFPFTQLTHSGFLHHSVDTQDTVVTKACTILTAGNLVAYLKNDHRMNQLEKITDIPDYEYNQAGPNPGQIIPSPGGMF